VYLTGKVALITGGGTGIGAATAKRFREEGAEVIVMGRRAEPVEAVARQTGAVAVVGDAAEAGAVAAAVSTAKERFGRLDIVVPNAGGGGMGTVLDIDDEEWAKSLHVNLTTAFVTVRESLPALIEQGGGSIVIVSSLAGLFAGPGVAGYTAAKHALSGLTRSIARDFGRQGVRCNAICPGWVRTPMTEEEMEMPMKRWNLTVDQAFELVTSELPLQRVGRPEEVASICVFLASEESSLMTGTMIIADGGASAVDLPTTILDRDLSLTQDLGSS
jgi:meso-butanediol dehydrogenase/(S,S)-butanediol dehydrogenase/diacetyl reductase